MLAGCEWVTSGRKARPTCRSGAARTSKTSGIFVAQIGAWGAGGESSEEDSSKVHVRDLVANWIGTLVVREGPPLVAWTTWKWFRSSEIVHAPLLGCELEAFRRADVGFCGFVASE